MLKMIKSIINDKVILLNTGALTISFTEVEAILKIILLGASIIYTLYRIIGEYRKQNQEKG